MKTRLKGQKILASLLVLAVVFTVVPFTKANADVVSYEITAGIANDEDCGTVSGGATVNEGETVTLVATPKTDWRFLYWVSQYGEIVSVDSTYTFTPTSSGSYYAFFENTEQTYSASVDNITFDTVSEGYGSIANKDITINNTGTGILPFNYSDAVLSGDNPEAFEISSYTLTNCICCFPSSPAKLVSIKPVDGLPAGTYKATVTINERDDKISPLVSEICFTVTTDYVINTTSSPEVGGTVTGGGIYTSGTSVTATANANEKFVFSGWYDNGIKVSENATYTFTANKARNLIAQFEQTAFDITVSADPSEQGTVTGSGRYNKGATVTVTAMPNSGYAFDYWVTQYGEVVSTSATYSFTASQDIKIYAIFKPAANYSVTFNSNGGSTVAAQTVDNGSKATKPTDPTKSGYTFGGWYTDSACTIVYDFNAAVTADLTLYAKWTAVSTPAPSTPAPTTPAPESMETPKLTTGIAHVQDIGDVSYTTEAGVLTIGTRGMGKRLEEITINFENTTGLSGTLEYRVHVQDIGWMDWVEAGQKCGTEGMSKRIEAIEIRLTGELAEYYSVQYCVHIQDYGDMQGWVKDGALAGTTGESKRIEELKIKIVPANSGTSMSVKYRVHVQDYGWEGSYAADGKMSGTSGESKRLEGIEIFLDGTQYTGGIKFKTHVQDYGWQGWSYDGEMSGTQGESKRLEGICIELYGEVAEYYDIYYRVHAQDIGWMAWAKNGECAGTAGRSARLEGIQIVLVPKGSPAPSATYEDITAVTDKAFIEGF